MSFVKAVPRHNPSLTGVMYIHCGDRRAFLLASRNNITAKSVIVDEIVAVKTPQNHRDQQGLGLAR